MCAATSQQFCVRWNSHLGSLGTAFPEFLAEQNFVDVTLACEGHQLHCHRLILASCSTYFSSLLRENPCKHPIIILPRDIKLWEIQALVDFMYKGHVNVSQTGLPDLLKSAEILQIRGLSGTDAIFNLNQPSSSTSSSSSSGNSVDVSHHDGIHNSTLPLLSSSSTASFNGVTTTGTGIISHNNNEHLTSTTSSRSPSSLSNNEIATSLSSSNHHQHNQNQSSCANKVKNSPKNRRTSVSESLPSYLCKTSNNNNGLIITPSNDSNRIIMTKEEPPEEENINETINDDSTNDQSESPPLTQEGDDSYIGKYSDFIDQSSKQKMLHYQNQNKQHEQDQEQKQYYRNQQQKSQKAHQLQQSKSLITIKSNKIKQKKINEGRQKLTSVNILNSAKKSFILSKNSDNIIEQNYNKNMNKIRLNMNNNSNNNQNNTVIKQLGNNRCGDKSDNKILKLSPIQQDEISENKDYEKDDGEIDNDDGKNIGGNLSDDADIFIVEPEIPIIEIVDDFNENFENNITEVSNNDEKLRSTLLSKKIAVKNNKILNSEVNDIKQKMSTRKNMSNNGTTRTVSMKNSKLILPQNIIDNNHQNGFENIKLINNEKQISPQSSESRNSKIILPLSSERRNHLVLPSSLKFNSQSMSIYVKNPSSDQANNNKTDTNLMIDTAVPISETEFSLMNSNQSHNNIQQISLYHDDFNNETIRSNNKDNYFEMVKTEYEINSNANNYESIICSPNVNILNGNRTTTEEEQNDIIMMNYEDIKIDENYYNNTHKYATVAEAAVATTMSENLQSTITSNEYGKNKMTVHYQWPITLKTSSNNIKNYYSNDNNYGKATTTYSLISSNSGGNSSKTSTASTNYRKKSLSSTHNNFIKDNTLPSPSAVILRSPRCNQPRSYSTDALYAALMDVKAGESIYRASQIHKVPRKTLRNWMKRWHIKSAYPMPKQLKQAAEKKKLKQMKSENNN